MHIALRFVLGVLAGGGLGFAYYRLIGCKSGTCPLTSNRYSSTIYGAVIGWLIAAQLG